MKKIVIATRNLHKIKEIKEILSDISFHIIPLPDMCPEVVEDGKTFEENAIKKAKSALACTGELSLADDSGLVVDYLDGAPGIYSSRFAPSDKERIEKLLKLLDGVKWEQRTARFVCVVAISYPNGNLEVVKGEIEGYIDFSPKGEGGFGYDPVFYIPEYGKTFAELSSIKNKISHRARAFMKVREILENYSQNLNLIS